MSKIEVGNHSIVVECTPGQSLLGNFLIHRLPIHTKCGGKARCGCCRIRIEAGQKGASPVRPSEVARLGEQMIAEGWRLSCQAYALRDLIIYMPTAQEVDKFCTRGK